MVGAATLTKEKITAATERERGRKKKRKEEKHIGRKNWMDSMIG